MTRPAKYDSDLNHKTISCRKGTFTLGGYNRCARYSPADRLQVKTAKRAVEFYGSCRKPRIDAMMHAETPAA